MKSATPSVETEAFPLSSQQRRLWFLGGDDPRSEVVLELRTGGGDGELAASLEEALARLEERHEILRTRFEMPPGFKVPQQVIGGGGARLRRLEAGEDLRSALAEQPPSGELAAVLQPAGDGGHRLGLSLSALAADRPGMLRLARELMAELAGKALPEEPLQYADYADWQAELMAADDEDAALDRAFWQRQDLDRLADAGLPGCRGGEAAGTPVVRVRELAAGSAAAVEELGQRLDVAPEVVPLAAWAAVLARFGGRDPVVVGTAFDGRDIEDLREAVGRFARWMPVTAPAVPERRFAELVERVGAGWREAGQRLVYADGPERDGAPVGYAATYRWQETPDPWSAPWRDGEIRVAVRALRAPGEPAPVELAAGPVDGHLLLELYHDPKRFRGAVADALLDAIATLLPAALAAPERPVGDLPLMGEGEHRRLVEELNATAPAAPLADAGLPVHLRFSAHAAARPDRPALVVGKETLPAGELEARANRLAHHLLSLGVGPEAPVGLLLDRSADAVVALLAVLKAGAPYLPLDPVLPRLRLAGMLADAGATVLLHRGGGDELVEAAGLEGVAAVDLGEAAGSVASRPATPPEVPVDGRQLAYVLFTSGSTGRPKGVAVEHRQLAAYVDAILDRLQPPPDATFATAATFAADLGNTAVFPALASGGVLLLVPPDLAGDPDRLGEHFRLHGVDYLKIVPSHLAGLLNAAAAPASLLPRRALVSGGEALGWDLVERVAELAPATALFNHYGPTETTVGALSGSVERRPGGEAGGGTRPRDGSATASLGTPLAGYAAYLLDPRGAPVPVGVAGELYLGGAGVARGYLGRPGLTAGRFVPSPFAAGGERLYRTGDLARHLPGGGIEFLGRIDQQVKIRGFRIETGEVEALLEEHPEVAEAVVVARSEGAGEPELVGYAVPRRGASPDPEALRHHLAERLPDYMVPRHLVRLDRLPLTANGKVDRAALPAPEPAAERVGHEPPRTPAEEVLCILWAEVLGLETVGIHDNFFQLGGDSILSIQVIARANREGLRLNPQQIFQHQTVAELAAVVGRGPEVAAEQGRVEGEVPLTPIQHWFFRRPMADRSHFNQSLLFAVEGLRPEVLAASLARLVEQHDALRLRFEPRDGAAGGWRQYHAGGGPAFAFHHVDLAALPVHRLPAAVESAAAAVQVSLDLQAGPVGRGVLFTAPGGSPGRLLLTLHHLVVDGVSWRILLDDLFTFYAAGEAGDAFPALPKTTSYRAWAERLLEATPRLAEEQLERWLELVPDGVEPLPMDRPGGDGGTGSPAMVERELDEETTRALLTEVPAAWRSEANDALLAALVLAFAGWTGRRELLVELEGHGREPLFEDVDLSRTVGWFTSRYPVHLELPEGDAGAALKAVKERLRAVPERGVGHGALLHLAGGEAAERLAARPRPEVVFNYLGRIDGGGREGAGGDGGGAPGGISRLRPADESSGPDVAPGTPRPVPFEVIARVAGGRLRVVFAYSSHRYLAATVEALADGFLAALRELVADARAEDAGGFTPSDFPLADLDQAGLDKVLGKLNREKA